MMSKGRKLVEPKFRFQEFRKDEEWERKTLGDLTYKVDKKNKRGIKYPIYSINNKNGFVPQSEQFEGVDSNDRGYDISLYKIIERNTFAYNPARINVGSLGYSGDLHNIIISSLYVCFKTHEILYDKFLQFFLETNEFNDSVKNNVEGGIRNYLFYENFSRINICLPSSQEQQKIASCLSSLDELITAHSKKLEVLKAHKKGLLQQLFPAEGETVPQLRFEEFRKSGEWELLPVGEKVDFISGFPFKGEEISEDSNGIPLMRGINITEGYVRHNNEIDRYFLGAITKLEKYKVQTNDLVIGMDGSKVGKNSALISEADSGSLLIQRVARLRAKKGVIIQFIFQHINSIKFHSYVDRINTSGGIPHISAEQINEFAISFPSFAEQQKIASCLSSLDELIGAQSQKLEAMKVHKKGLMQGLFPSISNMDK